MTGDVIEKSSILNQTGTIIANITDNELYLSFHFKFPNKELGIEFDACEFVLNTMNITMNGTAGFETLEWFLEEFGDAIRIRINSMISEKLQPQL